MYEIVIQNESHTFVMMAFNLLYIQDIFKTLIVCLMQEKLINVCKALVGSLKRVYTVKLLRLMAATCVAGRRDD